MILFKAEMAEKILAGEKTVTRRRGKKRWNVGAIHKCYMRPAFVRPPGKPFARVRILGVSYENYPGEFERRRYTLPHDPRLLDANDAEGRREGFATWADFWEAYAEINGPASIREPCWRVEFEVVKEAAS